MSPKMPGEYFDLRKQQILTAAWECFAEKGYQETTMRDIAKRLNLSTGVIYNYFKGKDDILEALHVWSLEQKEETFNLMAQKGTTKEAIVELFARTLQCCPIEELKQSARGNISMWAEALKRKNFKNLFSSHHVKLKDNIARFVREGIERNELQPELNPEAVAGFLIALLAGLQVQLVLMEGFDTGSYLEDIKKILAGNLWQDDINDPENQNGRRISDTAD